MGRLRVEHCLINRAVRQYGRHPTSDLLGVDYFFSVPPEVEFPLAVHRLELFVRFVGIDAISGRVRVTVTHLNADNSDRQRVYDNLFDLPTLTALGAVVHDHGFKLMNLLLPGEGVYAVRVLRAVRRPWERKRGWRVLAADYLRVTRAA